jgi:deoxyribodipyrimidine photolyase-related protein
VIRLVKARFADHPGNAEGFWWATTRQQALNAFDRFLGERFEHFGDYEDAISTRGDVLFHALLSPSINLGLITPREVLDKALAHAEKHGTPINALEGFVRQIIGWREFIRGVYRRFGHEQETTNFWGHTRLLGEAWYTAETGLPPLDDAIDKANRLGWNHHIERLMILGNLMLLCEVHPRECYRWFMEMFVDSSDWVMGPNVYGMGIFSDGGVFATKPYACGSNYLLKMSDYKKGEWCETVDGLYWRFIDRHRDFFSGNPRLAMMSRMLDKLDEVRRRRIFDKAEAFIEAVTRPSSAGPEPPTELQR